MDQGYEVFSKHLNLDEEIGLKGSRVFISDWNGTHPFLHRYLGDLAIRNTDPSLNQSYSFYDADAKLVDRILGLHRVSEHVEYSPTNVVAGDGSSALMATVWLAAKAWGHAEISYVPPMYYTAPSLLRILGVKCRPVSAEHAFEPDFSMRLPKDGGFLYVADPTWYAGKRVPRDVIRAIREWQLTTGGLAFVDGSFQFMQWTGERKEWSSELEQDQTIRLVCPTKALSVHGFRFAYLLVPCRLRPELNRIYEAMHGATSRPNIAFAHRALEVLATPEGNRAMIDHIVDQYARLLEAGAIRDHVEPECGYFMFGEPVKELHEYLAMGPDYFEQRRYQRYVRINLLNSTALAFLVN